MYQPNRGEPKLQGTNGHQASIHSDAAQQREDTVPESWNHSSIQNTLVMATQAGDHQALTKSIHYMVDLYEKVRARGHFMKYLGPTKRSYSSTRSKMILDALERHYPEAVLRVPVRDRASEYSTRWPKDTIQSFKTFVAIADSEVARHIAVALGISNFCISELCEGGLFIRVDDTVIASSATRKAPDIEAIRRHHKLRFIPHPFTSSLYRAQHEPSPFGKTHIDLDCCLLRSASGQILFLVSALYWRVYRSTIMALSEDLRAITYVVSDQETQKRVINLVALSPSEVIIPTGCPRVKSFLEEHLGRRRVICAPINEDFAYNGGIGGFGCMSSVIEGFHCAGCSR
jgi:hypothetical protein